MKKYEEEKEAKIEEKRGRKRKGRIRQVEVNTGDIEGGERIRTNRYGE